MTAYFLESESEQTYAAYFILLVDVFERANSFMVREKSMLLYECRTLVLLAVACYLVQPG